MPRLSVPSSDPIQRFQDILDNIACIEEFTSGMDLAAFSRNNQAVYAVKHALLIISEAAKKLGARPKNCARVFRGRRCRGLATT